jgi:hypothetical protein
MVRRLRRVVLVEVVVGVLVVGLLRGRSGGRGSRRGWGIPMVSVRVLVAVVAGRVVGGLGRGALMVGFRGIPQ